MVGMVSSDDPWKKSVLSLLFVNAWTIFQCLNQDTNVNQITNWLAVVGCCLSGGGLGQRLTKKRLAEWSATASEP